MWDGKTKGAFYADYGVELCNETNPCLFHYDSTKDETYTAYIEGESLAAPSFIIPAKGPTEELTQFVAGFGKTVYLIEWDGCCPSAKIIKELFTLDEKNPSTRLGIGHRDESGTVLFVANINAGLCGAPADGSIYLYGNEFGLIRSNIKSWVPGGFGYDKIRGFVYILDACFLTITRYRFGSNGKLSKMVFSSSFWLCLENETFIVLGDAKIIIDFKDYGKFFVWIL